MPESILVKGLDVKETLALKLKDFVRGLTDYEEVEFAGADNLTAQVRIKEQGEAPRYFLFKLSEPW